MIEPEKPLSEVGERGLLEYLRHRIPRGEGVTIGVGDDTALVETGAVTLITTDSLVEGVHFLREWTPAKLLGRKALSINLSDIAAMGGVPSYATVSLCLPKLLPFAFVDELYDGLLERTAEVGVSLVGGNLASTEGPVVIDVTLLGRAGQQVIPRDGARPGDLAVVTGTLGAAAAGTRLLRQGARLSADGTLEATGVWTQSSAEAVRHCLKAHLDPAPPLAFARALGEQQLAHAAMDVSDGLSGDLLSMCTASGVAAWVDIAAVPVDPRMAGLERARGGDSLALALHGGEDYQLLMAVAPGQFESLKDLAVVWNLPLAVVGEFTEGPPALSVRAESGLTPLEPGAFDHFKPAPRRSGSRS